MDEASVKNITRHPIISDNPNLLGHCDTLENTAQILELLEYLDLSEGLTKNAEFGLFLVLEMLVESVRGVSRNIKSGYNENLP